MKEVNENNPKNFAETRASFRLGEWLIEPPFQRISAGKEQHRIEPKVMQVLLHLASNPGQVVSKNDLLQAVWPDAYVGEDALIRCISILRRIFKDTPQQRRYISTVSKSGYCLLVSPVEVETAAEEASHTAHTTSERSPADGVGNAGAEAAAAHPAEVAAVTATAEIRKSGKGLSWKPVAAGVLVTAAVAAGVWFGFGRQSQEPIWVRELTTNTGEQTNPVFSPDGKRIAFLWKKDSDTKKSIYIKDLATDGLVRLTTMNDSEYSPVWSPDGRQIAFLSESAEGLGLYLVTVGDPNSAKKIYIPAEVTGWYQGAISWSPDGKSFLLADHIGKQPVSSISRLELATGQLTQLTTAPAGWEGDSSPRFSPDGKKIAFIRASEGQVMDLFEMPAEGGATTQLTHDGRFIAGISWSSDGRSILFSSNRAGVQALWQIRLRHDKPERLPVGTESASSPGISAQGKLAFVVNTAVFGVYAIEPGKTPGEAASRAVVSSTAEDSAPSASADGREFAFQSWRSGSQQIWISSADGQTLRELSSEKDGIRGAGSPAWSPVGSKILFDARVQGHSHIFVQDAAGGGAKQLTFGDLNDIVPKWSRDGRTVYFRSNRGGRWQLWKVSAEGGMPQPVTDDDGMAAQESPDGQWLYFTRGLEDGLWRMPKSGGVAEKVLSSPDAAHWAYYQLTDKGIYYLEHSGKQWQISFYNLATKSSTLVAKLEMEPPYFSGLSMAAGKPTLLISDIRNVGSHISLAEGGVHF